MKRSTPFYHSTNKHYLPTWLFHLLYNTPSFSFRLYLCERRVSDFRRALAGAAVLIGLAQSSSGSGWSGLRAGQNYGDVSNVDATHDARLGLGGGEWGGVRSLQEATDPLCSLPEEDPCTLNTTAIGMVEWGTSTYYDGTCEAGTQGCYTDGIRECRTCYLSTEIYMDETNATEASRPPWAMCPCCVPATLESGHDDVEVRAFNYSVFTISASDCTITPTFTPLVSTEAPAAVDGAQPVTTPTPVDPPTDTPPVAPTPEPTETPVPSIPTPAPDGGVDEGGADASDKNDGLSMGAKIGIGVAAAAGVIFLGIVGFAAIKASRKG
ncbi:hypothetical protein Esi_0009_0012 [Ectocarpus siliculosus]|uniref:Uncharacterized protein n=1 Tax=Ectocarpus siliculosus TaxID=2880 RepID=D8LTK8_ECTSI|nr:hypothetical protein Esi_0009_0012 [Ectocarpus siliculosus]|eukprot:CBN73905.1 hypothetical protein Esi_0009_0012 [Ectocarpus siliculosus]